MELAVLGFWLLCGIGAMMIANSKGYDGCIWFIAGFLFGPFALLIIGFMAPAPSPQMTESSKNQSAPFVTPVANYQTCLQCKESNPKTATVCTLCGAKLNRPAKVVFSQAKLKTCSKCGESNDSARLYCFNCQNNL